MSSAGVMPSHTASAIFAKTVPVSHDLAIGGYSATSGYANGVYIKSARFVAGGRRWYLRYYPNGCCSYDNKCVTFLLYHDREYGVDEDKVTVNYKVSLVGPVVANYGPVAQSLNMIYGDPSSDETTGLISRTILERSGYLSNDAFSVRCEFHVPVNVAETVLLPTEEPPPSSPTPNHEHAEALIRFITNDVPTDVTLEVGGETFWAHRRFLAAQSSVFAALFTGPMRENTAPSVRIDDMDPLVFKAMLDFIYTGNLLPPAEDHEGGNQIAMTQHLLVAADRYDLQRLKSICAEKLSAHIDMSTVATTLDLAQRHGCHELKDACFDFLAQTKGNLKAILKSEGFEQLITDYPLVIVELLARVAP
jgi:speckle-type POZ protein